MKLLLHTCCGPCFLGTWEDLKTKDFDIINFFYNPNIQPSSEYSKRKDSFKKAITGKSSDYIEKKYNPTEHAKVVTGFESNQAERCRMCYFLRLRETAKTAREQKISLFSTTLLVSPYQDHEEIVKIGRILSREHGVEFFDFDFRPSFSFGQKQARTSGLYMQKYCGCIFSKRYS